MPGWAISDIALSAVIGILFGMVFVLLRVVTKNGK